MKSRLITAIPVFNGEAFLQQTLESIAAQSLRPDRVVVIDNCSTDRTEAIVKAFTPIRCEWVRNPANLGLFGNFNRCLELAPQCDYLQIIHADDCLHPDSYRILVGLLEDCEGFGLAWCLDERIDEEGRRLSVSGKADGRIEILSKDVFLKRKAEISNQAFAATLMKTSQHATPCVFPTDMDILGDMIFWGKFGSYCDKLVHVHQVLAQYRWHGSNVTSSTLPSVKSLVLDEWQTMESNEALRKPGSMSPLRSAKLRGLLAVRAGIKAKRFRQLGAVAHSSTIAKAGRQITGTPLWLAGQLLVELRDLILFSILRRPRHPKNVFS